jgi:hypothetical protein
MPAKKMGELVKEAQFPDSINFPTHMFIYTEYGIARLLAQKMF